MKRLIFLMTTTFYPPYHVGGACIHVKWVAEELARQGHDVHVMFSIDAYEIKRGKAQQPTIESGVVHLHPLRSPLGRLETLLVYLRGRSPYFSAEFERLLKEVSPDVVHHHNISLLGYDLLRKRDSYLNLYTAHDYWLICQLNDLFRNGHLCTGKRSRAICAICALRSYRPLQLWRQRDAFARAIEDVDLAIAPSNYVRDTLSQKTKLPLVTIPNFVPPPPEVIPPSGLSDYFLYAGRLEKDKGIVELVEVFKDHWREIGARLIVAGTGSLERRLQDYVKGNDLEDVVRLMGWCDHDNLYSLYHDAHALVMPSLWPENAPLAALEALSVGTPVIASNMGGLPEIVELQGPGFTCDLGHLKDTLIRVRNTSSDREQLRDIYHRHFSPEQFISRYMGLIEEKQRGCHE